MRKFKLFIDLSFASTRGLNETFEVEDDATDGDIANAASDAFFELCSYGYSEIIEDDDNE